jgi:hypothetical protein
MRGSGTSREVARREPATPTGRGVRPTVRPRRTPARRRRPRAGSRRARAPRAPRRRGLPRRGRRRPAPAGTPATRGRHARVRAAPTPPPRGPGGGCRDVVAQLPSLAANPPVAPPPVFPRESLDQGLEIGGEGRSTRTASLTGEPTGAPEQFAVPAPERGRVDREHAPVPAGQPAAEGGEQQSVGGAPRATPAGPPRGARVVPERQELDVGGRQPARADEQAQQRASGGVGERVQHPV